VVSGGVDTNNDDDVDHRDNREKKKVERKKKKEKDYRKNVTIPETSPKSMMWMPWRKRYLHHPRMRKSS